MKENCSDAQKSVSKVILPYISVTKWYRSSGFYYDLADLTSTSANYSYLTHYGKKMMVNFVEHSET